MDLVSPQQASIKGNQYALMVTCVLADYVTCVLLTDKSTDTVVNAYLREVYCQLRGSRKVLSDNESEFKYLLF